MAAFATLSVKNKTRCFVSLFLSLVTAFAQTARVTLLPVESNGGALAGCRVGLFLSLGDSDQQDLSPEFTGLQAASVPYGRYVAAVRCARNAGASSTIRVDRPVQFFVVSSRHVADYAPGRTPRFTVRLLQRPPGASILWAKLVGVYLNEVDIEPVVAEGAAASFANPQPGRYVLLILSPDRLICRAEIVIQSPAGSIALRSGDNGCAVEQGSGAVEAQ